MTLLSHVRQVNTKPIHVAPFPIMLLGAERAVVIAQAGAETLISRCRAPGIWFHVRWWPETMRVKNISDVVVRAMVQLLHSRFFTMLIC